VSRLDGDWMRGKLGRVQVPETRYTRSGDVNIAYQVAGGGPVDLLWIPGFAQHVSSHGKSLVAAPGWRRSQPSIG
jgi:hypothetical protein